MMFKRSPLFLSLLLAIAGTSIFASKSNSQPTRPNIVFIFADDQRNDTLGCAGHGWPSIT